MLVIVPAFCFIFVKTWPRKATKDMMTVKVGKLLLIPSAVLIVIGMAGISSTTTAVEKGNVGANEAYVMVLMLALILSAGYWVAFLALRWGNGFGGTLTSSGGVYLLRPTSPPSCSGSGDVSPQCKRWRPCTRC